MCLLSKNIEKNSLIKHLTHDKVTYLLTAELIMYHSYRNDKPGKPRLSEIIEKLPIKI